MAQPGQQYLDFSHAQVDDEPLFEYDLPMIYKPQMQEQSYEEDREEAIDEELLQKTSELHEALRNQKLLRFQLLECEVMKKKNVEKCKEMEGSLNEMPRIKQNLKEQNRASKHELRDLQHQIETQRKANAQLLTKISLTNQKIVKSRQTLDSLSKESINSSILKGDRVKEHGYISIEKIRLQGENKSKKDIIEEIKRMMAEVKGNLSKKQKVNEELEVQYRQLMTEIQTIEKKRDKAAKKEKAEASCSLVPTDRLTSENNQTDRCELDKQNRMDSFNKAHQQATEVPKSKPKQKPSNASSITLNRPKKSIIEPKTRKGSTAHSKSAIHRLY